MVLELARVFLSLEFIAGVLSWPRVCVHVGYEHAPEFGSWPWESRNQQLASEIQPFESRPESERLHYSRIIAWLPGGRGRGTTVYVHALHVTSGLRGHKNRTPDPAEAMAGSNRRGRAEFIIPCYALVIIIIVPPECRA